MLLADAMVEMNPLSAEQTA